MDCIHYTQHITFVLLNKNWILAGVFFLFVLMYVFDYIIIVYMGNSTVASKRVDKEMWRVGLLDCLSGGKESTGEWGGVRWIEEW